MKKVFLMLMVLFSTSVFGQTALETQKIFDNTYFSIGGGVSTPMTSIFPVNPAVTVAFGKWFNPIWGAEIEGTTWFGSRAEGTHFDGEIHNAFRALYVGVNGVTNLSNLFCGYKGSPRVFELSTVVGTGWLHAFIPHMNDNPNNSLGVKTGLDFKFNVGNGHALSIRPAVYWNIHTDGNIPLQFNKNRAQLYVGVAYTYNFKTSNKTHSFKVYDIEALNYKIAKLRKDLEEKPKTVTVEKEIKVVKEVTVKGDYVIFFAKGSYKLSDEAKKQLDEIKGSVNIYGYASPEGSAEFNQTLSENRANAVAKYLTSKGVEVNIVEGMGVQGETSNRVVIVYLN